MLVSIKFVFLILAIMTPFLLFQNVLIRTTVIGLLCLGYSTNGFSQVCGDGICDSFFGENCSNCPGDCPCLSGQECIDSSCTYIVNGNVGVNNTDPKTALDIHGGLSHRGLDIVISNGDSVFIPENLSLAVISGYNPNFGENVIVVLPITISDGQRLVIQNRTNVKLELVFGFFNPIILNQATSIELIHTANYGWTHLSSTPSLNETNWKLDGNIFTNPFSNFIGTKDEVDLVIKTNDVERFRIKDDGKIGIGTSTPDAYVQINSKATASSPTLNLMDSTANNIGGPYIQFTNLANTSKLKIKGSIGSATNGSDSYIDFFRNSNTLMTLRGDGNLGVGTLDPTSRLVLSSSTSNLLSLQNTNPLDNGITNYIHFGGSNYSTGFISTIGQSNSNARMGFYTGYSFTGGPSFMQERLSISNDGKVGVSRTNPTQKLDVNGKLKVGDDSTTPQAGTIRWNAGNNDFEGFNGSVWLSLTKSSNSGWGGNDEIKENQKVSSLEDDPFRLMGYSIDIRDSLAVIGSNTVNFNKKGKAYIYKYNTATNNWIFFDTLVPSSSQLETGFGSSVKIFQDYIAVGAFKEDNGSIDQAGKIYFYKLTGGAYTEVGSIVGSFTNENFGRNFDVNESKYLVATNNNDLIRFYYVWGPSFPQFSELLTSYSNSQNKVSVAMSNNNIAYISSPEDNKVNVYKYDLQGGIWNFYFLTNLDNMSGVLDVSKELGTIEYLIVGKANDVSNTHHAFVYKRTSNSFTLQSELIGQDGINEEGFGFSVAITKDYCIVGNPESDKAYVFQRHNNSWQFKSILTESSSQSNSYFGFSVAMSNNYSVVGARDKDVEGNDNQGQVFFFSK